MAKTLYVANTDNKRYRGVVDISRPGHSVIRGFHSHRLVSHFGGSFRRDGKFLFINAGKGNGNGTEWRKSRSRANPTPSAVIFTRPTMIYGLVTRLAVPDSEETGEILSPGNGQYSLSGRADSSPA